MQKNMRTASKNPIISPTDTPAGKPIVKASFKFIPDASVAVPKNLR